jgi:hypothetical protein
LMSLTVKVIRGSIVLSSNRHRHGAGKLAQHQWDLRRQE